jgi:putative transport protein
MLALGFLLGEIKVKGISLGASGVFFLALLFGHFKIEVPKEIGIFGVVLFVYAIGLGAGPRFFKTFRKRGISFAILAMSTLLAGAVATIIAELIFGFGPALSCGLFTGALTSTPGLASALDTLKDPGVSVGYGIAYPFGVVGVVLFVQLIPRLLRIDIKAEAKRESLRKQAPSLSKIWIEIKNPLLHGKTISEFNAGHFLDIAISRITKMEHTIPAINDAVLQLGDRLRVIGTEDNLKMAEMVVGPRIKDIVEPPSNIASRTLIVTEDKVAGKTLAQLEITERYEVVVTRLWRDELEFVPHGETTLEVGDTVRIVGEADDCDRFVPLVGHQERKLNETRFLPVLLGLMLGAYVGVFPLQLPGGISIKLGMAGGPLFVALIIGHFGRLGRMRFRLPLAANYFIRELGLILFLASAGTSAGTHFMEVVRNNGASLFLAGALITLVPLSTSYLIARKFFKLDILTTLGIICGGMTSTPGLGVVNDVSDSQTPAVAYATVYPVALILVTVLAQMLALLLKSMG